MIYKFKYPEIVSKINTIYNGQVEITSDYLAETHSVLLSFLERPEKQISVNIEIDAPIELIWRIAAGTIDKFYSHQPAVIGVSEVNSLDSQEGTRFIVHRNINGGILDRLGEVILSLIHI